MNKSWQEGKSLGHWRSWDGEPQLIATQRQIQDQGLLDGQTSRYVLYLWPEMGATQFLNILFCLGQNDTEWNSIN